MSDTTAVDPAPAAKLCTPLLRTAAISAALTSIIAIIVLAFSWPAVTSDAHDISIAVAGPDEAVAAIETQLTSEGEVFDVITVDGREAAVSGIEQREYYGAIILGDEPELLTASANGTINTAIAQLEEPLQSAFTAQAEAAAAEAGIDAPEVTLTVTDVVPLSADDPTGALLTSAFFPMLFGGILGGVLIANLIHGTRSRLLAVGVYSAVGGLVLAMILQLWFGSVQGDFWVNVGAFSLAVAAIAAPIIGLVSILGQAGTIIGLVTMMLFANPISGAALPIQFLPGAWGALGQWFPPGASATLVRQLSYFPDASSAFSWLVLAGWVLAGVALTLLGATLAKRRDSVAAVTSGTNEALARA